MTARNIGDVLLAGVFLALLGITVVLDSIKYVLLDIRDNLRRIGR